MPPLFLNPGQAGTGVAGGCSCTGIPAAFLTVELASGGHIAPCYQLAFFCNDPTPSLTVKAVDDTGVLVFDPSPQAFDIDSTTGVNTTCTVTISNFNAEGIVVEWRRSADSSLIWKATNREHWNPAVRTPLKTVDYDPNCGINFSPECCLIPMLLCDLPTDPDPVSCCGCDGVAAYVYLVRIDDFGATDPDPATGGDVRECQCRSFAGDYLFVGCSGGNGFAQTVDCGSGDFAFDLSLDISSGTGTTNFQFTGGPGNTFTGELIGHPVAFCDWVHSGESVTLPMTSGYCDESTITVTPLALSSGGTPVDCGGNPVDVTRCPPRTPRCRGTSVWKVSRGCFDGENDTYVYYWTKVTDGCAGLCSVDTGRCYAKPPFVIDPAPMTDSEAAAYTFGNLVTSLGVEQDGTCECGTEYTPPACVCSGSSVWELARKPCYELVGVAYYLYYWIPISSDCTGSCTCVARIPSSPVLPTDPKSDAEVPSLLAALGIQYDSGCTCDAAYVEPDCPTCDCNDAGDPMYVTISVTDPMDPFNESFSGTYTMGKGVTDADTCVWSGFNEGAIQDCTVNYDAGSWTASFGGGYALYAGTGTSPCLGATLNKTAGPSSFPATITLVF